MATKLKNMKLTSVDLVRAGANQEADIGLFKSAGPQAEYDEALVKSARSILEDPDLAEDQQAGMLAKSVDDYRAALEEPEDKPEEPDGEKVMVEKEPEEEEPADLDEIEEVEKNYDTIEEVRKFNPFHDALGRFASKNGFKTYSANIYSKAGAKAVVRSAMHGHGDTKNSHASSAGTVGSDYSIANDTYTAANNSPKPKTKKPKTPAPEGNPADKWRPDWMPETKRRNHEKQDRHLAGSHEGWEAVQDLTGCSEDEAKAMYDSVYKFSKSGYEDIRKYAYEGPPPSTRQADAENIEKFISASPQWDDGPLYRGIDVKPDIAKKILADAKAGKAIGQRGPASWSSDRDIAENFATKGAPENVSIIFCTGGKQNGTSIKHLSNFPHEDEVLMSNDARWKASVDPVEISPGVWEIVCEAIDVP